VEAFHCLDNSIGLLLQAPLQERDAVLRINRIGVQQIVFDIRRGLPEHIGNDGIQRQVAHSESVLEAALFTGTHGYQFAPIAGELPKDTDILAGDITYRNKTHPEEVPDPFGILLVVLVAFDSRNPFGIRDDNADETFKDIPNGNPILAGTFHTDILAAILKEPLPESKQASVGSAKVLLLTLGNQIIPREDCGDEEFLVHINATTDRNRFTHTAPPSIMEQRGSD